MPRYQEIGFTALGTDEHPASSKKNAETMTNLALLRTTGCSI